MREFFKHICDHFVGNVRQHKSLIFGGFAFEFFQFPFAYHSEVTPKKGSETLVVRCIANLFDNVLDEFVLRSLGTVPISRGRGWGRGRGHCVFSREDEVVFQKLTWEEVGSRFGCFAVRRYGLLGGEYIEIYIAIDIGDTLHSVGSILEAGLY